MQVVMPPDNDIKYRIRELLRDYASIIPSVIAVMNGLLAIYSTHYPFEALTAKLAFIIIIGSLSLAAIVETVYSHHLVLAARAEERRRILKIRGQLGIFISHGANLLKLAATASVLPPIDQANEWVSSIENFFATNMGDPYVVRFRDSTGMPPGISIIGVDEQHQNLWRWIYSRMMKLEQFIKEFMVSVDVSEPDKHGMSLTLESFRNVLVFAKVISTGAENPPEFWAGVIKLDAFTTV